MPRTNVQAAFARVITRILAERREVQAAIAKHQARLAEIDGMFARYGLSLGAAEVKAVGPKAAPKASGIKAATTGVAKRKLHPNSKLYKARVAALQKAREARWAKFRAAKPGASAAKAAAGKQRKRRTYEQTSEQFILGLLAGGTTLTTAQINQAWKEGGRRGRANTTLTLLGQVKKLARKDNKGGRGSVYSLA